MVDRKGIPHMRKKPLLVFTVLLSLTGLVSTTQAAQAYPLSRPSGSYVGVSIGSSRVFLILKPGQAPIDLRGTLVWHSQYDSDTTSNWIGGFSQSHLTLRELGSPGSRMAELEFNFLCNGNNLPLPYAEIVCQNGDFASGDGYQAVDFTSNGRDLLDTYDGNSVDIFTVTPPTPALTLPPDFLAPKTYGNPASVTGTAPALPATPVTPTAPAITAGTTSVIYNGVPQSATYSVDQKSSCSTTYNGSAIAPVQAGTYAVSITCSANSLSSTATTTLTITKAAPVISWSTPGAITSTTKLGASQLNAFSYTPGSFTYSASAGSSLPVGDDLITATFTPTDTTNYTSATMTVTMKVTA
jgi:hypothetical protein